MRVTMMTAAAALALAGCVPDMDVMIRIHQGPL